MTDDGSNDELAVFDLALTEARSGCADLIAQPELIRKNVGAMLGFAAVATSLLGISGKPWASATVVGQVAGVIALIAVVALGVCAGLAMRPVTVRPGMDGAVLVTWAEQGTSQTKATKELALYFEKIYAANKPVIADRFRYQEFAAIALSGVIVALAVRAVAG